MPDAVIHPTSQELTAFALGKLSERATAIVAAHLESCIACRQAVAGVSADSFLNRVRDAKQDKTALPPSLPQPPNAPSSANQPAIPVVACPGLPPELARHPKYLILRELGRGGMGVVYQARQTVMNRPVVIKVINRALLDRPESLERFRREIRAAAQLSHRNIVTAYDAEQAGELHMLVMEFVPGQSLAEVVEKKGPLPVANACYYVSQAALGLQHAHERGMVHRDIKPQNLMLTPKGQVKILDFGLAKIASERGASKGLTSSDACMGTPEYIAPEQAEDAGSADIRADLYSLGCTLYCLLAGRPPFREDTWVKTVLAHIQKMPQPLPELRPQVSAELWQVIARLLSKQPAQRYEKPIEVAKALAPFIKSRSKPDAKEVGSPASGVSSPTRGTKLAADTNQVKKILQQVPAKAPSKELPAKEEASPFADPTDAAAAPKPSRPAWWKRPGVLASAFSISLALILMAGIIIKVRLQPQPPSGTSGKAIAHKEDNDKQKPPPAEAFVVLEIDQPGAEVLVDGKKITVNVPGENESIEINVKPGQHRVEVKKDGFKARGEEVTLENGGRRIIRVSLEKEQLPPPAPRRDAEKALGPSDGFVPLFNGKDLTGWNTEPGQEGDWHVKNGVLSRGERAGMLWTERGDYGDFRLRVRTRVGKKCCAQLYIRDTLKRSGKAVYAYAVWLNCANPQDLEKTGTLSAGGGRGTAYLVEKSPVPSDEWFWLEVIAQGNRVIVEVNGQETADYIDPKRLFARGHISLSTWTDQIEFSNIEIKELPTAKKAEPKEEASPTKSPRKEYDDLAKGRWVPVLPSVEEFNRLLAEKAYVGNEPKFVGGVLELNGRSYLVSPIKAKDAIVRAWVTKSGSNTKNVALFLRRTNDEFVAAWFNGGGWFGIGRWRDHVWKDLTDCHLAEPYEDYFEFAFAAVGDRLIAYANGRKILEATDDAPLEVPAAVGVGTNDRVGYFRNIQVQVLDKIPAEAKGASKEENSKPGQPKAKKAEPKKKASLSDRIPDGTVLTGTYLCPVNLPNGESGTAKLTITERKGNKVKGRYDAKRTGAAEAYPGFAFEGKIVGNKLTARSVGIATERTLTVSLKGDILEGTVVLLDKGQTARVDFTFDKKK